MQEISLIVTDLDNTLYDWFEMWHCSFSRMLDCLVKKSGIEQAKLEKDIKSIFQRNGTSEYEFLIEEIASLKKKYPDEDLVKLFSPCIQAYREARIETYHLYPTVLETLLTLKECGCLIVGYTESRSCYTLLRIKKLKLDGVLDYIYSPPDHHIPFGQKKSFSEKYRPTMTIHRYTEEKKYKPNPKLLLDIIYGVGAKPKKTIYIGDSLMKDVHMAQMAKIADVYAQYGASQKDNRYELLRHVSHWRDEDVEQEKKYYCTIGVVEPNYILKDNFAEVLDLFNFTSLYGV